MKKIYLLIALAVGLVSSCSMDTEPLGSLPAEEATQTPEDFISLRNGLYSALRVSVGGDNFNTTIDVQSDQFHATALNSNTLGDLYRWDFTPQNSYVGTVYANYQATISRANVIIDGYNKCDMSDATVFTPEKMDSVKLAKGDAFFARAYCIFMLSQYFCADYDKTTANEPNTGVSYRLDYAPSSDPSTYPARKTLAETMKQVQDDLDSAAFYIQPLAPDDFYYVTPDAITALRARLALAMDEYKIAADYAASLVDGGYYSLANGTNEIIDMWSDNGDMETIMQMRIGGSTDQYTATSGSFYLMINDNVDFIPTATLLNLYGQGDRRFDAYFTQINVVNSVGASATVYGFNKFPAQTRLYTSNPSNETRSLIEPKVFRIAEMYLIAAEGYAQADDLTKAAYYLNALERNRIAGYQDQTFASKESLMQEIMNEREREMVGEGTRIFDLKRWHVVMQRGDVQDESILGFTSSATMRQAANANRMTWPIPQNETDLADQIVQNPGY